MKNSLNRILIETTVRRTLKQIKDDPERSTRNLVDMALNFSEGRFQQHFLKTAQNMLRNEQSSYYRMIPDAVATIDTERIITFGMNVGYNSCTVGAKTIRTIEAKEHFNIPWSVTLSISGQNYYEKDEEYLSLIEQGQKLGIYTWIINASDEITPILELIETFPPSAFVILCSPDAITDSLLDESNQLYNVMYALEYTDGVENACRILRTRGFLYSIYYSYTEKDVNNIMNGDIMSDAEILHPAFTMFFSTSSCPLDVRSNVYQYIRNKRAEQKYRTIPYDLIYDNHFIDGIISDESVSVGFDQNGKFFSVINPLIEENYSFFDYPLAEILKKVAPKKSIIK